MAIVTLEGEERNFNDRIKSVAIPTPHNATKLVQEALKRIRLDGYEGPVSLEEFSVPHAEELPPA